MLHFSERELTLFEAGMSLIYLYLEQQVGPGLQRAVRSGARRRPAILNER